MDLQNSNGSRYPFDFLQSSMYTCRCSQSLENKIFQITDIFVDILHIFYRQCLPLNAYKVTKVKKWDDKLRQ
jgi:hypothetical protein